MALKRNAWVLHTESNTAASWSQFCKIRNKVNSLVREDKQEYQTKLLKKMEENPKLLYKIVNDRTAIKPGVFPILTTHGMTETAQGTADALAKFYSEVFNPKQVVPHSSIPTTAAVETLGTVVISPELVQKHLLRLNVRKSPGADGITPLIVKQCHQQLSQPLCDLFNHSLIEGKVAIEWKSGVISPIYKGGSRSDATNYRPVTLLPVISKIMERMVTERIVAHLETNNLLSVAQHGFRKHRSCMTNLITTLDDWTKVVDGGGCIHACYLDISKAFDRVDHYILLEKLQKHGITKDLHTWMGDYLTDRHARVRVDGVMSKKIDATSGVPQGSVLGPVLFLIYMNDLPQLRTCKMVLFADDIKIWTQIRSREDCLLLQRDLSALQDWSEENKLPFNFRKCTMLQLGSKFEFTYHLGSQDLAWNTSEKDLGIWICGNLKSSMHCGVVYKSVCMTLGILRRIFGHFTQSSIPRILNIYLRPKMEYAIEAWAPWLRKDIALFDRIYHRATKLVVGLRNAPYSERLRKLNLMDFTKRRIRSDLLLTYRILRTENHPLSHIFQKGAERATRSHAQALSIPHSRRDCRRHFYSIRACILWNNLPEEIVNTTVEASFKSKLDVYIQQHTFFEPQY